MDPRTCDEFVSVIKPCVHFVGFKPSETRRWAAAVRVWGEPDFVHDEWDNKAYEDFDRSIDTMIIACPIKHLPRRILLKSGVKTIIWE